MDDEEKEKKKQSTEAKKLKLELGAQRQQLIKHCCRSVGDCATGKTLQCCYT